MHGTIFPEGTGFFRTLAVVLGPVAYFTGGKASPGFVLLLVALR